MAHTRKSVQNRVVLALSFVFTLSSLTWAEGKGAGLTIAPGSSEVTFDAIGRPSALKIHGSSKELLLNLERVGDQLSGSFEFPMTSLDSGVALRDRHMKEKYLEVGTFPTAKFEWKGWILPAGLSATEESKASVTGKLTLHGVTQPVEVALVLQKKDDGIRVRSDFSTKISQYGIAIPSFAGITVAEDVKVHVEFTAVEKSAP